VDTFLWYFQLTTLHDLDGLRRFVAGALGHILDLLDDVVAFKHFTKDNMTAIEPAVTESVSRCTRPSRSSHAYLVTTVVMKNCEPFVSRPAFAMLSKPFLVCFSLKFSSGNRSP